MKRRNINTFRSFLEELQLNLGELSKTRNGKHRGDILIDKIEDENPLTIDKTNKPVEIDKLKDDGEWVEPEDAIDNITNAKGEYDPNKAKNYLTKGGRYQKVFKGDDGDIYQLNQFKKTTDFGSSGAGRLTRQFESIQCIYLGIRQGLSDRFDLSMPLSSNTMLLAFNNYKKLTEMAGSSLVYLPEGVGVTEEMIEDFASDKDWSYTFCKIPNRLWSDKFAEVNNNMIYAIYHIGYKGVDSPFSVIWSKYRQFSKSGGFSDVNISKFCPADVYMVSVVDRDIILEEMNNTKDIEDLISVMDRYFDERKLVPLSLKKIKKDTPISIITNNEDDMPVIDFSLESIELNDAPERGIGSKIVVSSVWKRMIKKVRKMNFDSSDTSKRMDVDGEVEGSASRHGKVSFNYINKSINKKRQNYSLPKINKFDELSTMSERRLMSELNRLHKDVINLATRQNLPVKYLTRGTDIRGSKNRMISKIQSLQILNCLLKLRGLNLQSANDVTTEMFKYALSIQTDYFVTPKYLRVI